MEGQDHQPGRNAAGIGSRVRAGGHGVTVVGKDLDRAGAIAADVGGARSVKTSLRGDPIGGKLVVDIANPVHASFDAILVPPDGSATAERAALAGGGQFVKAFDTTFAAPLPAGQIAAHQLDVLIAGDDVVAKGKVAALGADGGLEPIDVRPLKRPGELMARACCTSESRTGSGPAFQSPSTSSPHGASDGGRRLHRAAGCSRTREARG